MKSPTPKVCDLKASPMSRFALLVVAGLSTLSLAGCRHAGEPQVAGWALVEPTQRHPILVSQQPQTLSVRVYRGSHGLSSQQRAQIIDFVSKARAADTGNSKIVIEAPSGSDNEVAAMHAVHEMRELIVDSGFADQSITIEAHHQERGRDAPVRISYMRFVAEGPECGQWPANLANERQNLPFHNLGCATQKNLAAMVANPADLLGPRSETPRSSERRAKVWEKYEKGQSTGSDKSQDERVQVKGAN